MTKSRPKWAAHDGRFNADSLSSGTFGLTTIVVDSDSKTRNRQRLKLERLCTKFEREWRTDNPVDISQFVQGVEPTLCGDLVTELVAVECELRDFAGESPRLSDFLALLPQWTTQAEKGFAIWEDNRLGQTMAVAPSEPLPFQDLKQVGDYRILRQIGQGGMGVVYEAEQESLRRRVAIKILTRPNIIGMLTRFQREARAVAMLHHTNIVEVFGSGVDQGVPYIAMQLIEGRGLDHIIANAREAAKEGPSAQKPAGPLAHPKGHQFVAAVGLRVAEALQHAHEKGVLHRDIKPANLLIDKNDEVHVSDFGLAKLKNDDSDATVDGSIIGTLRYLPPETLDGKWDVRADVYSLGVTLYEALALRPAFGETSEGQLIDQIRSSAPAEPLRSLDKHIPLDLETIVTKAMSPDPRSRYQTAGLLADDLRRYSNGQPILARPASVAEKLWKWSKRNPALSALLSLIFLVVSIGFPTVIYLWQSAEVARIDAESQRALAVTSDEKSKAAAIDAKAAEAEALAQKRLAELASEASEVARYGSSMMLAQKYLSDGNSYDLRRLLSEWIPAPNSDAIDRRGWEWKYLQQFTDSAMLTMSANWDYAFAVAVRPDDSQIAAVFGTDVSSPSSMVRVFDAETGNVLYDLNEHKSPVYGLAYSPDGSQLATIGLTLENESTRGTLTLWDASNGVRIKAVELAGKFVGRNVNGFFGHRYLPTVKFSSDGTTILTAPSPIELVDAQTLESIWKEDDENEYARSVREAIFLKDGNIQAMGDFRFRKLNRKNGKQISMRSSRDASYDLTRSYDGQAFSVVTSKGARIFKHVNWDRFTDVVSSAVTWASVSGDSQWILMGHAGGNLSIESTVERTPQRIPLLGHLNTISDGVFSHDGKWFVTSSLDGTVKKWSIESQSSAQPSKTGINSASDIAFRDDGETIVCAGQDHVTRPSASAVSFDGKQPKPQELNSTKRPFWPRTDFAFSHDGTRLAAPYREDKIPVEVGRPGSGKIGIWSTNDWVEEGQIELGMPFITSVAWNDDSSLLAVAGFQESDTLVGRVMGMQTNKVEIFSFNSADNRAEVVAEIPATAEISSLAMRNGLLAIADHKGIKIYELNVKEDSVGSDVDVEIRHDISKDHFGIFMDFSPSGDRLAIVDDVREMFYVIDVESGEVLYEKPSPRTVKCIRFSPNGRRLAVVGHDSKVHFCDSETGTQLLTLAGSDIPSGSMPLDARVIFSPDGKRIATHNLQKEIKVWAVEEAGNLKVDEPSFSGSSTAK